MLNNLVEGGARLGKFQVRNGRIAVVKEKFTFWEPRHPGQEPESRTCYRGDLLQADGRTVDTGCVWEQSGATQNSQGVIQRTDLVILVEATPEPEPVAEIEAPLSKQQVFQAAVFALESKIAAQEKTIREQNACFQAEFERSHIRIAGHEETIRELNTGFEKLQAAFVSAQGQIATQRETIDSLEGQVSQHLATIEDLNQQLAARSEPVAAA